MIGRIGVEWELSAFTSEKHVISIVLKERENSQAPKVSCKHPSDRLLTSQRTLHSNNDSSNNSNKYKITVYWTSAIFQELCWMFYAHVTFILP